MSSQSHSHPDANAFVQAIVRNPAEITTRLVFADWLEETGTPSNIAWAHFIRLMANADQLPPGTQARFELNRRAAELASHITATIPLDAEQLVGNVEQLHQLLPQPNFLVTLAGHTLAPDVVELISESMAREDLVVPLSREERHLVVAAAGPNNVETRQKLEFILNFDITFIGVRRELIEAAIDHSYGRWPLDPVRSLIVDMDSEEVAAYARVYFVPTAEPHPTNIDPDKPFNPIYVPGPTQRLLWAILFDVIKEHGTRVQIGPAPDRAEMRYLIGEEWVVREALPLRLLGPLADEIARVAGLYPELDEVGLASGSLPDFPDDVIYTTRVLMTTAGDGPIIDLQIGTRPPNEFGW